MAGRISKIAKLPSMGGLVGGMRGAGFTIKVVGVPQLIAKLRLVGQVAYRETGAAAFETAQLTKAKAKEYVHSSRNPWPERQDSRPYTDDLYESIDYYKEGAYSWTIAATDIAAEFEEFGAAHNEPHPFLGPAAQDARKLLVAKLIQLKMEIEHL